MSHPFGNDEFRFGSAAFVTEKELEEAGMFEWAPDALYAGKAFGRCLYYHGAGGVLITAGARSGKLTDILGPNLLPGTLTSSTCLILDPKGELAAISQNQTADDKRCIYFNPYDLHGTLPQNKFNPFGHIRRSSPRLVSDIKFAIRGLIGISGDPRAEYFESAARRIAEAIALTLVKTHGELTFPDLYDAILALGEGGQRWNDFAWQMHISGIRECVSAEEQIAAGQKDSSGGYLGIVGELQKAIAPLSDPQLREALSGPFDASLEDLCASDHAYHLYLMVPVEVIEDIAPVLRAIFACAKVLKSRFPQSPRQTWILDEGARLKNFEEVVQLFTDGAGVGIRPVLVLQDIAQADDLGRNAARKISSSAGMQLYFGVRDPDTCERVSKMIGDETLSYDDPLEQGRARVKLFDLLRASFEGSSGIAKLFTARQTLYETTHLSKQRRSVMTPDEVRNLRRNEMIAFVDGLSGPVFANREPYYDQPEMAGLYLPNPYHPPLNRVRVATRRGHQWRPVLTRKVPTRFAHLPQYARGTWTYVGR